MRHVLWIISMLIFFYQGAAQDVQLEAMQTEMLIGDHLKLEARIFYQDAENMRIDFNNIDTSTHFELINPGEPQKIKDGSGWQQDILITSFDSGQFLLPPLKIEFETGGVKTMKQTNPIPISIGVVPPDSLGLAPIKDIIQEKANWQDYIAYIIIPLVLGLLIGVLWWWNKNRQSTPEERHIGVYVPPFEKAWNALDQLEREKLWQSGQVKEYESRISQIFRGYLEGQFKFPALEWTTREIVHYLSELNIQNLPLAPVQEILDQADMVKYAKVEPGPDVHINQMTMARKFISISKDMNLEEE